MEKKIKEKFEPLLWSGTTCLFHGKVELNDVTQDGGASKRAAHPRGRRIQEGGVSVQFSRKDFLWLGSALEAENLVRILYYINF